MIEQHIFVKTELGLSTLSKSKGLTESYIESNLKPLYSAVDIYYLDGKDFPGLKCAVPLGGGLVAIGTGVKGKKNSQPYIHTFVVNGASLSLHKKNGSFFLSEPAALSGSSPILPAVEDTGELPAPPDFSSLKRRINISEAEYKALLAAAISSREQGRNVFISPGAGYSIAEIELFLRRLYSDLPYYIRCNIGFMTLFGEVNLRPESNVYFLPPEKLRLNKTDAFLENLSISKDYVFDFENKKYLHIADLKDDLSGEFLSFVAPGKRTEDEKRRFFDFAEEAGEKMGHERKMSLRFYDDLVCVYTLHENAESLPQKLGRVTVIFTELLKAGAKEGVLTCYSEFLRNYRRILKSRSAPSSLEVLRRLVLNYDCIEGKEKEELYDILTLDIEQCLKSEDDEILFTHINAMRESADLYNRIIENKMLPGKGLIRRYFTYMFSRKKTVHSLLEYLDSVYCEMPKMQDNEVLSLMASERIKELYDSSPDWLEALCYMGVKCAELKEKYEKAALLFDSVYYYALSGYMASLVPGDITASQAEKFPLPGAEELGKEISAKHKTVLAAKEILALSGDVALSFVSYDAFGFDAVAEKLSDDPALAKKAEADLKKILKNALPEKKSSPKRMLYIIAYYTYTDNQKTDFDAIYDFIDRVLETSPFEFIEWYLSSDLYMTPIKKNGRIFREVSPKKPDLSSLGDFYSSTERFFSSHGKMLASPRETGKMKTALNRVSSLHPDYRALTLKFKKALSAIARENYSPARRIATKIASGRNFKFIIACAALAAIVSGGIAIGSVMSRRLSSGEVKMKNYADSEVLNLSRLFWAAYKKTDTGDYSAAAECIDGADSFEILDYDKDEKIVVSFGTEKGLKIDGISISALIADSDAGFSVFVTDESDRKLSVGVSDYDITSGSSVYSFSSPMTVKNIIIEPKDKTEKGNALIKEVNAYIIKE